MVGYAVRNAVWERRVCKGRAVGTAIFSLRRSRRNTRATGTVREAELYLCQKAQAKRMYTTAMIIEMGSCSSIYV